MRQLRFSLSFPDELIKKLDAFAKAEGRSRAGAVRRIIEKAIKAGTVGDDKTNIRL